MKADHFELIAVETVMRDGMKLPADLYLPQGEGPFATIVERGPRFKEYYQNAADPIFRVLASKGYAVLSQNAADRWRQEGVARPFFSPDWPDANDGYDTIEWAADQPWSNGRVGGFGYSYPAWCQWVLAAQKPPSLVTMFVGGMAPRTTDWQVGGIYRIGRQLQWTLGPMTACMREASGSEEGPATEAAYWILKEKVDREKWLWFLPQKELPPEITGAMHDRFVEWLDHCNIDRWKLHENFGKIDIPVFHRSSWYDRLSRGVEMFSGMRRHAPSEKTRNAQRMVVGPWSHVDGDELPREIGAVDFGSDAEGRVTDLALPWFDYWLKGLSNQVMDGAPLRIFVMGANTWRDEEDWPLARERRTAFYFRSKGSANTPNGNGWLSRDVPVEEPPDDYFYDPRDPVMTIYSHSAQDEPHDQRVLDHRRDVLVFQTEPLAAPMEVTGIPEIVLFASSSAPDTDFTAKLIDVAPDGFARNLCYGIVRARYRNGLDAAEALKPGEIYEFRIELLPTSNVFLAGHRIRLDISSSDFPNFDRNHNIGGDDYGDSRLATARQRVFHDSLHPSHIVLPVIPG